MKLSEFLNLYDFLKDGATVKDWGTDGDNNEIYIIDDKNNIYNFRLENRKEQGEQ